MFERLRRQRLLDEIKKSLSKDFKPVSLKDTESFIELSAIFEEYGTKNTSVQAKIDEKNQIHLVVKYYNSILYHAITTNYFWFIENVNF